MMKLFQQAIGIAVIFGIVLIIPGSWDQFSLAISKMSISIAVLTLTMLFMTLMIYCRLKYWPFWTIVLGFLALFRFGVEFPPLLLLFSDHLSADRVALTLGAVLLCWGSDKLIARYEGSGNLAVGAGYSFVDSDEMISLNLDDKEKSVL